MHQIHQYIDDYIITHKHTFCTVLVVKGNDMIAERKGRQIKTRAPSGYIYLLKFVPVWHITSCDLACAQCVDLIIINIHLLDYKFHRTQRSDASYL